MARDWWTGGTDFDIYDLGEHPFTPPNWGNPNSRSISPTVPPWSLQWNEYPDTLAHPSRAPMPGEVGAPAIKNSIVARKIQISGDGSAINMALALTVGTGSGLSDEQIMDYINSIQDAWRKTGEKYEGIIYSMNLVLSHISEGVPDFFIRNAGYFEYFSKYSKCPQGGCSWATLGGAAGRGPDSKEENTLRIVGRVPLAPYFVRVGYMDAAHEFGHWLGLSHQWNGTNSIMSYSIAKHVTGLDLANVYDLYTDDPSNVLQGWRGD